MLLTTLFFCLPTFLILILVRIKGEEVGLDTDLQLYEDMLESVHEDVRYCTFEFPEVSNLSQELYYEDG